MKSLLLAVLVWAALLLRSAGPDAASFSAAGFDFSDELGGLKLISVSGSGSPADPIVLIEELAGTGPAILVVRGHRAAAGDRRADGSAGFVNLAVIKIVINSGERVWTGFDLELRQALDSPSPYEDGLSFDQGGSFSGEPFGSDRFRRTLRLSEPYDRVQFHDGSVAPGTAVRFNFTITDPTPVAEFYLLQEPLRLVAGEARAPRRVSAAAMEGRIPIPVSRILKSSGVDFLR